MKEHPELSKRKFDRIIFNFPHAGFHGREDDDELFNELPSDTWDQVVLFELDIVGRSFGAVWGHLLRLCGGQLSRVNVLRSATHGVKCHV
ncbi:hypothetical protein WN943_002305 [Citrus x changshan-huyou]